MDPTERFSSRVDNYVRYRPSYPRDVLTLLEAECELTSDSVIADVGSGTGILTRLFLEHGNPVWGVEPNDAMRGAAEVLLADFRRFRSVAGRAEATTLPNASVDFVVAGQAFHWFQPESARAEFGRILRPDGWVALIWNERRTEGTSFLEGYERLLRQFGTDYEQVAHTRENAHDPSDFFPIPHLATFPNAQHFDLDGLRGRLLSSSYTPEPDDPRYSPMLAALESLFQDHQREGVVSVLYDTEVYYGTFSDGM